MQFSIRLMFALTVIGALAFFAVRQSGQIILVRESIQSISEQIGIDGPRERDALEIIAACESHLRASPVPSPLLQSVKESFPVLQRKYGSFAKSPDKLSTMYIPECNAEYHQRYQARVFVPNGEAVQLRMAVFPCTMYRSRELPPLSQTAAETIVTDSPFLPATPKYLDLANGEHRVLVEWFGDRQEVVVSLDGVKCYSAVYDRESNLSYKYQSLGSGPSLGQYTAREDQEVLTIRSISPGGGASRDPMQHTWKCDLVRGSQLSKGPQ